MIIPKPLKDRLLSKILINPTTGCWEWQGYIHPTGQYGQIGIGQKHFYVHRISYEQFKGPIPEGFQIDHLCKVRHCINPAHLEAVTPWENNARSESISAQNIGRTFCRRGHPLSGDNVYTEKNGKRHCIICKNWRRRFRYANDPEYRARERKATDAWAANNKERISEYHHKRYLEGIASKCRLAESVVITE